MGKRCFGRIGSPALLLLALAAGLGLRLWLAARLPLEADEAVVGLMARHIGRGERPVFYYGQTYMGALEAYLIAPVFALLGPSVATLRLVPIALGLVAAWLAYRVGRAYYGERTGLFTGLWFALSPLFLSIWTVKARAGYVETLVFGLACLWLAALPATQHPDGATGRGGDGET
ncbi:MAG: glycosyltransferase family 39 protein, partial [Chloroflexi bacterium]|nr:glycosyltransferase family 39 protein [Chloroflexota bacterium]